MKYIRLLRLEDHYPIISAVAAAGIYLQNKQTWILLWVFGLVVLSCTAFLINELVDRKDTDKYSWNPIHVGQNESFNMLIVLAIFISFSVVGFYLTYKSGMFFWGIATYIIGLAYSLKPIRLKNVFALDILAQILVWFLLPFLAPFWLTNRIETSVVIFSFSLSFLVITTAFPYQLADFIADKKAKLHGTHILLGMKKSLYLGIVFSFLGIFLSFFASVFTLHPWAIVFVILGCLSLFYYSKWLTLQTVEKQTYSIQNYVRVIKPITQILTILFFLIWLWF